MKYEHPLILRLMWWSHGYASVVAILFCFYDDADQEVWSGFGSRDVASAHTHTDTFSSEQLIAAGSWCCWGVGVDWKWAGLAGLKAGRVGWLAVIEGGCERSRWISCVLWQLQHSRGRFSRRAAVIIVGWLLQTGQHVSLYQHLHKDGGGGGDHGGVHRWA